MTNNETLDSTKEYNKVKVIIEADGIIRGIYCDGKYIDFAINANPQLSYSFYTNKGPHLLILESKHKKTKVIVNIKTNIQIPFDMRSVIPAIRGHSFFKYFYGCKVNVLNRYLGRQTVFFC